MITCNGPELPHCHCLTFRLNMNRVTRSIGYIFFFLTIFTVVTFHTSVTFYGYCYWQWKKYAPRQMNLSQFNGCIYYKCQWEIYLCRLSIFHCRFFVWSAFNKDLSYSYAFRRNIGISQKDILHTRWATRKTPAQFGWLLFRVSLKKVNDLIMEEFADTWAKLDIWKIAIAF